MTLLFFNTGTISVEFKLFFNFILISESIENYTYNYFFSRIFNAVQAGPPRKFLGPRAKGNLAPLLQFSK